MANTLWMDLFNAVLQIFETKIQQKGDDQAPATPLPDVSVNMNGVDWDDPTSQVSKYFTVHDCLYLPTWKRMATEDDGATQAVKDNLIQLCMKMDILRDLFGCAINVHCTYRPPEYSVAVGGSEHDVHTVGEAMDFDCNPNMDIETIRDKILNENKLEELNIRMEKGTTSWIHIDTRKPGPSGRHFTP